MNNAICVPDGKLEEISALLESRRIPLLAVAGQQGAAVIRESTERKAGTSEVLYAGGWIGCETARTMADKLEIKYSQMGELLNHLDIKIRDCGLGCF